MTPTDAARWLLVLAAIGALVVLSSTAVQRLSSVARG